MKNCSKCKKLKENTEFYTITSKQRKAPYLSSTCKECDKENNAARKLRKDYRQKDNAYKKRIRDMDPDYSQKEKERMKRFFQNHPGANMYYNAKRRAKVKGYDFDITIDDIVIPEFCPYLGIPLIIGTKDNYENTPSLDRIDNTKGYIKGNVLVVSKKGNSMKNSASFEELTTFCNNIMRIIKDKDIVQTTTKI